MELDDLKNTWQLQEDKLNQPPLTPQSINAMTQQQQSNLQKIRIPEIAGIIICLAGAVFISVQFQELNTLSLQIAGVLSILLLIAISFISWTSIQKLPAPQDFAQSYATNLEKFARQKKRFVQLQKINAFLCYLLLVSTIILMSRLLHGKDLTTSKYFWLYAFTAGYLFLACFARLVTKYYGKTLKKSEELLRELKA